jgi:hypothetical protein
MKNPVLLNPFQRTGLVCILMVDSRNLRLGLIELTIVAVDADAMVAPCLYYRSPLLLFSQSIRESYKAFYLLGRWGNLADGWKFAREGTNVSGCPAPGLEIASGNGLRPTYW